MRCCREAFPQQEYHPEQGDGGQRGGDQPGRLQIGGLEVIARHQPAQHRPDDEAEAEGGADHAHAAGALLGRRHVGDIGLCRGDVAGTSSREGAGREHHPQLGRKTEPKIGERGSSHAGHQHRPAADPVAEPAPQRRGQHRHQRIDGEQQGHLQWRSAEALRVKRQQRNDQPEPDEVDKDDEKKDRHVGL